MAGGPIKAETNIIVWGDFGQNSETAIWLSFCSLSSCSPKGLKNCDCTFRPQDYCCCYKLYADLWVDDWLLSSAFKRCTWPLRSEHLSDGGAMGATFVSVGCTNHTQYPMVARFKVYIGKLYWPRGARPEWHILLLVYDTYGPLPLPWWMYYNYGGGICFQPSGCDPKQSVTEDRENAWNFAFEGEKRIEHKKVYQTMIFEVEARPSVIYIYDIKHVLRRDMCSSWDGGLLILIW